MNEYQMPAPTPLPRNYFDHPSPARIWNYLQGGKDNYPLDRHVAELVIANYPRMRSLAAQCRQLLIRAVRYVAEERGVRQFLDIGCGLPAPGEQANLHEVAQRAHPDARVVYVDSDRVVLAHAQALLTPLTPRGCCAYIDADVRETGRILTEAAKTLDFDQPVAVVLFGVLATLDYRTALDVVERLMDRVRSGSWLMVNDGADCGNDGLRVGLRRRREAGADDYRLRTPQQLASYFVGLELVEPGVVRVDLWRPNPFTDGRGHPPVDSYVGVARKP